VEDCFQGCALVAIGSLAFHATLLYQAQLADELPMIGMTSCGVFLLFDTEPGFALRAKSLMIIAGLIIFDALFAWT
jgi:dihydroceramidase